jgi:hypothetical protein
MKQQRPSKNKECVSQSAAQTGGTTSRDANLDKATSTVTN